MRTVRPPRPCRRRRRLVRLAASVVVTAGLAAGLTVAPLGVGTASGAASAAAAPSPKPPAKATPKPSPGMGSPLACPPSIYYSITGKPPTPRPLPAPASSVGGERLGAGGLQVTADAATPPPAPKATAWVVADLGTGRVLAACNAHVPLAPASSLKVLTALALVPKIDPKSLYTARAEDANVDGTKVGLVPGSVYTAGDLWHALLMSSANDAATGLAALAGGTGPATEAMHGTARSLGAEDTVAHNTSGLDEPGQVSSAYDLALFGRAALANPAITRYAQTRSYTFPGPGAQVGAPGRKSFQIQNHDRLLYNYPGALGIKNGWTSTTGGSFVGAAERGGRRLVVTVLAADPQTWHMCAALLDWGFSSTTSAAEGVGRLVDGPGPDSSANGSGAAAPAAASRADRRTGSGDGGMGVGEVLALGVGGAALAAAGALAGRNRRSSRSGRAGPASATSAAADRDWQRRRSW